MADSTIRHRVDLAVAFMDRTTGMPASGNVSLTRDGKRTNFRMSPDGVALFTDTGREDFTLGVSVSGYEHEDVRIEYGEIDEQLPYVEVYMIPQDVFGEDYLTIDGSVDGLTDVDSVCVDAPAWIVQNFDSRKLLLTVQSIYKNEIGGRHYGIIANDRTGYVPIEILGREPGDTYRVGVPPDGEVTPGLRLAYRVTGRVQGETCLLRLPNRVGRKAWILRVAIGNKSRFRLFDIDKTAQGAAGRRIGLGEIMSRAAPGIADAHEYDAEMKGG
ncbi:MAG: hypothetical protein LBO70_04825 [Clostridiales Family XIII bacterium]|jgi:hypothetical protein|nr:hypothetical protein [Clostridiales Family XIII bacterium]